MKRFLYLNFILICLLSNVDVLADSTPPKAIPKDWSTVAKEARDTVVKVECGDSQGSGFYINDRVIITNFHVVENVPTFEYNFGGQTEVIGLVIIVNQEGEETVGIYAPKFASNEYDIAFLFTNKPGKVLPTNLSPIAGEPLLVIGSPENLDFSLTSGIVSGIRKNEKTGGIYIQTDAAINGGNSGGPLIDSKGQVLGIATFKLVSSEIDNIAFGISIKTVTDILAINDLSHMMKDVKIDDIKSKSNASTETETIKDLKEPSEAAGDLKDKESPQSTENLTEGKAAQPAKDSTEKDPAKKTSTSTSLKLLYIILSIVCATYLVKRILNSIDIKLW